MTKNNSVMKFQCLIKTVYFYSFANTPFKASDQEDGCTE